MAQVIGKGFAYVQHGMDRVIEWGLASMKKAGEAPVNKKESSENPQLDRIKLMGRKTLGFIGTLGDEYYRTYEELKAKGRGTASKHGKGK